MAAEGVAQVAAQERREPVDVLHVHRSIEAQLSSQGGFVRGRRARVLQLQGDRVAVDLSPYDLTRGRITYRYR